MNKGVKFRNHFSMVIEKNYYLVLVIIYLVVSFAAGGEESFFGSIEGKRLLVFAGVIAALAVWLVININAWRKTYIEFDEKAVVVWKNTINNKKITIAINNIANINITRNIFEAVMNTRKVKIDTNVSATSDVAVELYLKKADAEEFQRQVMNFVNGKINEDVVKAENTETDIETSEKDKQKSSFDEIVVHCICTANVVGAFIAAMYLGFGMVLGGEEESGEVLTAVIAGRTVSIVTILIFMMGLMVAMLKSFFLYYKFIAVRKGSEINISYGFFKRKNFRIPVSKINAVIIKKPIVGRIFKKCYAEIVCAGVGDEEKELSIAMLCTSRDMFAYRMKELLPEFIPQEVNDGMSFDKLNRQPKPVKLIYMAEAILLCIIAFVAGFIIYEGLYTAFKIPAITIVVITLILCVMYKAASYLSKGYSFDAGFVRIATGAFSQSVAIVPYEKIESMELKYGPVMGMLGMKKGTINIKSAGIGKGILELCRFPVEKADMLIKRYRKEQ